MLIDLEHPDRVSIDDVFRASEDLSIVEREVAALRREDLIERELANGIAFGPYHREWMLERAPERAQAFMRRARQRLELEREGIYPPILNTRQGFAGMDTADVTPGSFPAIATTTTETNITGTVSGQAAAWAGIPARDARAGKAYRISFGGIISNTATPTVIWTPRWGQSDTATSNLSLGASPTITTVASLANHAVYGEFTLGFRSLGVAASSATASGNGFVKWGNAAASASSAVMGSTVVTTADTLSAQGLMISLTWGTNSGSNTFTCQWIVLQSLN